MKVFCVFKPFKACTKIRNSFEFNNDSKLFWQTLHKPFLEEVCMHQRVECFQKLWEAAKSIKSLDSIKKTSQLKLVLNLVKKKFLELKFF